ncbi:MAG: tRNA-(ms[2]io[6]A)-hydroxylase [Gammaproteobacteria bacterium]|nr:tRNA-(ms[2]io[6]A)-hydroxylase [Gammaproteobacteria bacterium]MAY03533.1 tRNA-(ms[2]io[6]A)-hydroxylase [Gammaproteobacteria bacterium]|tara:strand:+ start:287 stop:865 length:579 start_codon:yes stop_codon:yes gene_type:complete
MLDFNLREASPQGWLDSVLSDFDQFLVDHASCEKKASGMAMSMISHYPDKPVLVKAMLNLALEELAHFRDVMEILLDKGLQAGADSKDEYVNRLLHTMNRGSEAYLLDRLLIASIIEARGAERFGMIAEALPAGGLKTFYENISASEARHYLLFLQLAEQHCDVAELESRLEELLDIEAEIMRSLPLRAALH